MAQSKIQGFGEQLSTDVDAVGRHALKVWLAGTDRSRSAAHIIAAASANATVIKASAAEFRGCILANTSAAWRFVKLHATAVAPTPGAGVVLTLPIAPGGVLAFELSDPVPFATGLGITIVTGSSPTDTTAVAAGDVVGLLLFD
jgi:hypothetical protein